MKTALFALLFLVVTGAIEASPQRGGGGGGGRGGGGRRGGRGREVTEALANDNGALEWFVLPDGDDCETSDATIESITIEEGRRGRKHGGKHGLSGMREARETACTDVAIGGSICMCQRVVSDTAPAGTVDYIETCGDCEETRNGDVALEPDNRRDDKDQFKDMMEDIAAEYGIVDSDESDEK